MRRGGAGAAVAGGGGPQGMAVPEADARLLFQQLMVAVDYIHRLGIANRDIKVPPAAELPEGRPPQCSTCCAGSPGSANLRSCFRPGAGCAGDDLNLLAAQQQLPGTTLDCCHTRLGLGLGLPRLGLTNLAPHPGLHNDDIPTLFRIHFRTWSE